MDLDLRKLRYFVAVAEELHFGRAAEALHIAQPVLSRQIRAFEDELRVALFVRDRRRTELTAAGRRLLADARPLLEQAALTRREVVRAARPTRSLTVGFMPGLLVTPVVRALTRRHPDLAVEVTRTGWDDQVETIRDGRVDVGLVRPPVDGRGLVVRVLLTEPRLVVLPAGHRLSGKESVDLADLVDEHLLQAPDSVPEWPHPSPGPRGMPVIRTVEEKLEHVAAGRGVVVLPRSTVHFYARPDVCGIPVADIAPGEVAVARPDRQVDPLVEEAVEVAADLADELLA